MRHLARLLASVLLFAIFSSAQPQQHPGRTKDPQEQPTWPNAAHLSAKEETKYLRLPLFLQYPAEAKARHITGTVVLHLLIGPTGRVEDIDASGDPLLVSACIEAVTHSKNKPYLRNGQPVEVETTRSYTFYMSTNTF